MSYEIRVTTNLLGQSVSASNIFAVSDNGLTKRKLEAAEFAAEAADVELAVAFAVAGASLVHIRPTVDVVMKTNSSSAPADTKTILASKGFLWFEGCGFALSDYFSGDVTTLFFTNSSEERAGEVEVIVLDDSTP